MDYNVGDVVNMKKQHPCGCSQMKIMRVGMDFRLRCEKCGRDIMLPRNKCEKMIKSKIEKDTENA